MRSPRQVRALTLWVAAAALLGGHAARAGVPSFSGADGAGATSTGGSGGNVYHVTVLDTKLNDSTPGTLYYGLTHTGGTPTTVVFDVGGTVWLGLKTTDTEGWDTQNSLNIPPNVTIAGQTAPGGITLMGSQIKFNGQTVSGQTLPQANDIMRNVTLAVGYGMRKPNGTSGYYDNYTYDNVDVNSSGVIIDHATTLFATDESISANELANKVTVQYTTIAQGQAYPQADAQGNGVYDAHAFGDLWGIGSNATTTFSHNLYANENGRIPAIQTVSTKLDAAGDPGYTDFRNNVIYNWYGYAGYGSGGEPGAGQFVNNYYKVGPTGVDDSTSGNNTDFGIKVGTPGTTPFKGSSSTKVYQTGNIEVTNNGSTTTNLGTSNFSGSVFQSGPYTTIGGGGSIAYNGTTDTAQNAFTQVTSYAGANWQNRDLIDQRLVYEVIHGTGKIAALDDPTNGFVDDPTNPANDTYVTNGGTGTAKNEWNTLLSQRNTVNGGTGGTGSQFTRPANYDTDADGMPDIWEAAMGLQPNTADNNGTIENNGYTNLDNYLNELGAWPASTALVFGNGNGTLRYAEIGNWQGGVFEPSRYDTAQINSGTVKVDVPGQHAGALVIATNAGNTASLSVSAGWIDVASNLFIGPAGTGSVSQSGGLVRAGNMVQIGGTNAPGTYTLTGGTLATPMLTTGAKGGTFNFSGGVLHANTVNFSLVNNGGTLAPGSDSQLQLIAAASMQDIYGNVETVQSFVGSTHVVGNLTLKTGALEIDLASLQSFDTLAVDGSLTLGGSLNVVLDNGYTPVAGNSWKIATAGSIFGNFTTMTPGYSTQVMNGDLYVVASSPIPEPGTASVVLAAGAILLKRRRRLSIKCN